MPRQQTKTIKVVRNDSDSYLESILRWDDQGGLFALHLPFGKITLDRSNKIVDKSYLSDSLIS